MSKPPPARGVRAGICQDAKNSKSDVYDPRGAGTAWSHGFLNQKPWHPLSFRNQLRKWEAEQKKLAHDKHALEAKEEFDREQEHFRSVSSLNPDEQKRFKDKQQIAFMYMKPPGLDAALSKEKEQQQANTATQFKEKQARSSQTTELKAGLSQQKPAASGIGDFDDRGPMSLMLKARANYEVSHHLELRTRSPPRGGFGLDSANQQFVIPSAEELKNETGDLTRDRSLKKKRKEERKKMVENAEAILRAAGYDVDHMSKQFMRGKHHKSSKSRKKKRYRSERLHNADVERDSPEAAERKKLRKERESSCTKDTKEPSGRYWIA